MLGSRFTYFNDDQIGLLRKRTFELLSEHGVKLDHHPRLFELLSKAGADVDESSGMVRFPVRTMEELLSFAPREFKLGARSEDKVLTLPRPDGTFYTRTVTGAHGWIEPETSEYRKLTSDDLADWAKLVNLLNGIDFMSYLFCDDVPVKVADVAGLATVLKNTDKHVWVQPYSPEAVEYLIKLGEAVAGGKESLKKNPVISMIACSLAPRAFKMLDLEIILQSAEAGLPIQACSLPGAGGTAPATLPAVIVMAAAEILAMVAMSQAVSPGTPVVACPIIFATDMRSGRSLQSSVEAMRGASGAVQFIKTAFNLPTHNYGTGADSPIVDAQCMSERALLSMLMGMSGLDILGGAGQLEVATAVSPLQLIIDNEVLSMVRRTVAGYTIDDDQLAWDVITKTKPGDHFMLADHTVRHCRDGLDPINFVRVARDTWERQGAADLMARVLENYRDLMKRDNPGLLDAGPARELDGIVQAAKAKLAS